MAKDEALFDAIRTGNRKLSEQRVRELVAEDTDVTEMLNGSMIPAMRDVGARFSRNEAYVPELLGPRAPCRPASPSSNPC